MVLAPSITPGCNIRKRELCPGIKNPVFQFWVESLLLPLLLRLLLLFLSEGCCHKDAIHFILCSRNQMHDNAVINCFRIRGMLYFAVILKFFINSELPRAEKWKHQF